MAASASAPPGAPRRRGSADMGAQVEQLCCVCHLPADPVRKLAPLRRGYFVHYDCERSWTDSRDRGRCELCDRKAQRLSVWEFMAGLPAKLTSLLLPLFFAVCAVGETAIHLITLQTWHLLFASTFAQAHHLVTLRLSATSIIASASFFAAFANRFAPFAVAPFARWVKRLETRCQGWWGTDGWQVLALFTVEACLVVLIADMAVACIFGLLPFSLGRIILWCMPCFNFDNVDEVDSYTSTSTTILVGYGFILSVGVFFVGLNTFRQYLTGERLTIIILFKKLSGIFFRGILRLIIVANIGVNLLYTYILHPLFIGWLLDICTSKLFDATMSQRFKLLIAPSFDSMALHWFTGRNILSLRPRVFVFLRKVLKPGIMIRFVKHNIREPFYIFYFKRLPGLFDDIAFIALVVLVPTKIAVQLTPEVFPLDITYFDRPAKGTSFWQGPRYYAEALSGILYLKFLVDNTVLYLEWLVWRVRCYWLFTVGDALWNIVSPREHYDRSDEVNNRRRFVVVQTMPQVVLSWLAVAIFNSVMLLSSISIGRTLVFAVPELPLRGQMKSNDLFAIATGFGVVSIVIAASRDAFVRVAYGGTRLVALEMHLIFFIWILFIPLWIGLLVDLSLLSPFIGLGSDVPVLDFFCTWSLGRITQIYGTKLARRYKVKGGLPSLADSIENYWTGDKLESLSKIGSFATKLVAALGVPYVLAKGVFPRLGYPAAVNSMVYHFAWLGCITLYAVCYLAKVACTMLHDSIRDDRYGLSRHTDSVCTHAAVKFIALV
ncbi:probable E3 ubiquitin ligase SUD1 [Hordeum vulgare subsp. vulgare]|uniref:E3 ubiquitin-protein ligase MARCHF6-like C-terminal domain-containing protein n=1 Tax=Hordeum vulgare subsp. vulgare TaxID=112509 RepID=A0A8I7B4C1_HORVV|nr:probable E3 ubiquitin ligase SUD1 [Hordeum vulgare subsp. vulgare]